MKRYEKTRSKKIRYEKKRSRHPLYLALGTVLVFVLMLKNIYSIWAFDKIRIFAMYKSIGCSRRQLGKLVVKEALQQALPAALISLIPGNILSYLIIEFIRKAVGNSPYQLISGYRFSIAMNLITAAFVFICVALSASLPARKLSRMGIIEALKGGFELKKDKRRRQAKNLEEELRKNNFVVFKASTALLTFSFTIIFFVLLMGTGLHIERNYWERERFYDLCLFLRTHRTGIPTPFQRLAEQLNKKDYLIYTQKYAFMYPEMFLSSEFKKKGFYKKAEGKLFQAVNMFFARRRREIFLLKSCGIRESELKALLMRDYFYFMLRSVLCTLPLCMGLTLWHGTLSLSFTFKHFLIGMNYPALAAVIALIAVVVYLFFRFGAKRFQGMNIAEEVRG